MDKKRKVSKKNQLRLATVLALAGNEWTSEAFIRGPFTMVRKTVVLDGGTELVGIGFAKVCWPDVYKESKGIDLASKRAYNDIADQIIAAAKE